MFIYTTPNAQGASTIAVNRAKTPLLSETYNVIYNEAAALQKILPKKQFESLIEQLKEQESRAFILREMIDVYQDVIEKIRAKNLDFNDYALDMLKAIEIDKDQLVRDPEFLRTVGADVAGAQDVIAAVLSISDKEKRNKDIHKILVFSSTIDDKNLQKEISSLTPREAVKFLAAKKYERYIAPRIIQSLSKYVEGIYDVASGKQKTNKVINKLTEFLVIDGLKGENRDLIGYIAAYIFSEKANKKVFKAGDDRKMDKNIKAIQNKLKHRVASQRKSLKDFSDEFVSAIKKWKFNNAQQALFFVHKISAILSMDPIQLFSISQGREFMGKVGGDLVAATLYDLRKQGLKKNDYKNPSSYSIEINGKVYIFNSKMMKHIQHVYNVLVDNYESGLIFKTRTTIEDYVRNKLRVENPQIAQYIVELGKDINHIYYSADRCSAVKKKCEALKKILLSEIVKLEENNKDQFKQDRLIAFYAVLQHINIQIDELKGYIKSSTERSLSESQIALHKSSTKDNEIEDQNSQNRTIPRIEANAAIVRPGTNLNDSTLAFGGNPVAYQKYQDVKKQNNVLQNDMNKMQQDYSNERMDLKNQITKEQSSKLPYSILSGIGGATVGYLGAGSEETAQPENRSSNKRKTSSARSISTASSTSNPENQ